MSFVGRAPDYTRPGYEAPPTPEPGAGDWPNAYARRQDIVLSPAEAAVSNFILPLVLDLTGVTERSDGGDIRIEVAGLPRPYELAAYDDTSKIAHVWVRLADYPTGSALTVRVYAGKDDAAGEADASACYAGYLQVIDGATGLDLTGQGRSVTPNGGVVAGTFSNGWPCGVYDGAGVMSSAAASAWIEGLSALSMQAIVDGDGQAITGAVLAHSALPGGTSGGSDNAVLSWIAETGDGTPDVWHMKAQTVPDNGTTYTLGAAGTATPGLTVLHAAWESGDSPDIYTNGDLIPAKSGVPRTGTTRTITDGFHVGGNFNGKIGQLRVAPFVISPLRVSLEADAFLTPLALMGRGDWYGPSDEGDPPVVANPVSASATAGQAEDIDVVAASSKPGVGTVDSVTQGARGSVSIVAGKARYTASGNEAGTDAFTFTLSDGTFLSTGRCDVAIAPAGPAGGDHWSVNMYDIADYAPASPTTVNVANDTQLSSAISAAAPGHRIKIAAGDYAGFTIAGKNGTASNPIILEAASPGAKPNFTGAINIYDCEHVVLYQLKISGQSPAVRIGRNVSGEFQHDVHIARCELLLCGLQAVALDRRTRLTQIRNNLITTNRQADAAGAGSTTLIWFDTRPGIDVGDSAYWSSACRIEHNIIKTAGTLNSISGARQGHAIYLATDRYQGNADQGTKIKYNFISVPRKYAWELKAGGVDIIGNYIKPPDANGANMACLTRQASDAAPVGSGANIYKGNVYDDIDYVGIISRGNGEYHYANGEHFINGTRLDIWCASTGGANGYVAADNFRMDYCEGGVCRVGYYFTNQTFVANVQHVQLHNCTFTVSLLNQSNTIQAGLTQLEAEFPTHTLLESEVGPDAFSP